MLADDASIAFLVVQPFGFELPELMGAPRRIDLTD